MVFTKTGGRDDGNDGDAGDAGDGNDVARADWWVPCDVTGSLAVPGGWTAGEAPCGL